MTRKYLAVYERGADDFSGYLPDVPGCVSAGGTIEEMRANMREALQGHLECMADYDDAMPEAKTSALDFSADEFESVLYCVVEPIEVELPVKSEHRRLADMAAIA